MSIKQRQKLSFYKRSCLRGHYVCGMEVLKIFTFVTRRDHPDRRLIAEPEHQYTNERKFWPQRSHRSCAWEEYDVYLWAVRPISKPHFRGCYESLTSLLRKVFFATASYLWNKPILFFSAIFVFGNNMWLRGNARTDSLHPFRAFGSQFYVSLV